MAVNFNRESVFDLKPMSVSEVRDEVHGLLLDDENIISAFKTVRDQLLFTNKRIIAIDVQGITGRRKSFSSMHCTIVNSSGATLQDRYSTRTPEDTASAKASAKAGWVCTFGSTFGLLNIIKYGYGTFTTIVGPVMLVPLIISVPYRLKKDKENGIIDENYELIQKEGQEA